ncbi:GDSL esterase/lipase LIP-4-like [Hordeum vulgare subsp. vulgare]|uniref:GDSL esterase/lipase LIP-4-like n=1 Tax=Hordeum vulgare subsp. vulgare TaxID=112509 RepID=UPI001D1A36DD|nr:GDSL esterase/lipase LIP-4-like [Hordeum vulgare subsp. vulgare]
MARHMLQTDRYRGPMSSMSATASATAGGSTPRPALPLAQAVALALALALSPSPTLAGFSFGLGARQVVFNFSDSNSDTGDMAAAKAWRIAQPEGRALFHRPTDRFYDGRLIIDFL